MSDENQTLDLPDIGDESQEKDLTIGEAAGFERSAAELAPVFDVPVHVKAVLGRAKMDVASLLELGSGSLIELDRKVGEAIDIFINNRLVARGELVVVDDHLGVTMTEIIKDGDGV
ncbi:MAG: flagellar motor switch protein FliN [Caulobacterales bacterium]|nr:flagellar motor switch protein FliN [Caulobacterales bacterium]MCA0371295.1 flagellar motor switch protein FliN [Pseudomonadota bacterium]